MQKALETLGIRASENLSLDILLGESFNGNVYGMPLEQMEKVRALRDLVSQYNNSCCLSSKHIQNSREAAEVMYMSMKDMGHEEVRAAFVNASNRIIATETIFRGSTREVTISPKDILSRALCVNATGIILYHNHPSTDVHPSMNDISQTARLKSACESLDITLLDHIIIGKCGYYSFSDESVSKIK